MHKNSPVRLNEALSLKLLVLVLSKVEPRRADGRPSLLRILLIM